MRARQAAVVCIGLLWSALALAAPASPAAIDQLMHKSGLWRQLEGIGGQFVEGVDQGTAEQGIDDAAVTASLRESFKVACSPARLRVAVAKALAADLSAKEVAAALAWLGTDAGKRITKLEEDASETPSPENPAEIIAALPPARRELFERLAQAVHAGEVGATTLINMSYGLARGIRIAAPGAATQDPEDVREALLANRAKLVAMMEEQQVATSALIYATVSDSDLKRYLAFAESPAGKRYHAATSAALDKALTSASVEAGRMLASSKTT